MRPRIAAGGQLTESALGTRIALPFAASLTSTTTQTISEEIPLSRSPTLCVSPGTVCMYGQTGSGKTYTMFGDKKNGVPGLVDLCVEQLFDHIEQQVHCCKLLLKWVNSLENSTKTHFKILFLVNKRSFRSKYAVSRGRF